jgi:hypothetical protein
VELLQWTVGVAVAGLRIMLGQLTAMVVVIGGIAATTGRQTTTAVVLTMMRTKRGGR